MNDNRLIGSGWQFPPCFRTPSVGPEMVSGEQTIEQSIYVLLNTQVGERFLKPSFGCGLAQFLFHSIDATSLTDIKEEIAKAIAHHEKRISLQAINFDTQGIYDGLLSIELSYLIKDSNSSANMVFPFYLTEG
ncbi:GPW/gp25 family protein [Shewanella surugensis]|uniref:GPW/gp25 family protein n=1 Tax=Shewanella surugensis TaxID=212020 RepID=A0ABT0L6K6_9GAMM|nr:GPW/gp25 family protein [Shewanella surugensis]MCL1123204.1 GPW/gp25 family protein [Shewanella surugensis]